MTDYTVSTLAAKLRRAAQPSRSLSRRAQAIDRALTAGAFVGGRPNTRAEILRLHRKSITDTWGEAVFAALGPKAMPTGRCRWCLASLHARVSGQPPPPVDNPTSILLGPMCQTCTKRRVSSAAARVALVSSARQQHSKFHALVASGKVVARDRKGRVTRLRTAPAPCRCGCESRPEATPEQERAAGVVSFNFQPTSTSLARSYHDWVINGGRS